MERYALKTDFSKSFFIGIIMLGFVYKNGVSAKHFALQMLSLYGASTGQIYVLAELPF